MIFPFKRTWRSRLDLEYLDENSKRKHAQEAETLAESSTRRNLKQFADYASKETSGQGLAGGFFHSSILINPDGSRTAPSKLSNTERKRRISAAWFDHMQKFPSSSENPVIQHRLVFSMSETFHDRLVNAGINPDRVLQTTMKKVMRKFADRFHAGDAIGYAYGIHHDTDNLHVHVALCPRTAKGSYVGCSMSRSSSSGNKNQIAYLMKCFEQENESWNRSLDNPEKLQQRLAERFDADKMLFVPRLTTANLEGLRQSQTAEAIRLQQMYQSIRNLEMAIAAKRQYFAAKRSADLLLRFIKPKTSRLVRTTDKLAAALDRRSFREMQNLLFKIKRDYRGAHKRYAQTYAFRSYANRNTQTRSQHQQQGHQL